MTERDIQDVLHIRCRHLHHVLIVPNVYGYSWESDLLSITRAGQVIEYEIKISRSDFRQDRKKERHDHLCRMRAGASLDDVPPYRRGAPNRFYYAAPEGLLTVQDLPPYAGLLVVGDGWTHEVLLAPRLHRQPIEPSREIRIGRSMMYRYWDMRAAIRRHNGVAPSIAAQ